MTTTSGVIVTHEVVILENCCVDWQEFDKFSGLCYDANVQFNSYWTLLSRGGEGPALRDPGNQAKSCYGANSGRCW